MFLYCPSCDHSWISNELEEIRQNGFVDVVCPEPTCRHCRIQLSIVIRRTSFPPDQERFQSTREKIIETIDIANLRRITAVTRPRMSTKQLMIIQMQTNRIPLPLTSFHQKRLLKSSRRRRFLQLQGQ